jgi:hypothetical protein
MKEIILHIGIYTANLTVMYMYSNLNDSEGTDMQLHANMNKPNLCTTTDLFRGETAINETVSFLRLCWNQQDTIIQLLMIPQRREFLSLAAKQ